MTGRDLPVTDREVVALYILLKHHDADLDDTLAGVLDRIEGRLFDVLSIDQLERIEDIYREMNVRDVGLGELSR